jgi:hypothetical protein
MPASIVGRARSPAQGQPVLPVEVIAIVLKYSSGVELKSARLLNRHFDKIATPFLFERIIVDALQCRLLGLAAVLAANPAIAKSIKRITYDARIVSTAMIMIAVMDIKTVR